MKGADILCGTIARRIFQSYSARFMRDIKIWEEIEMEKIIEHEKPYAVFDPQKGSVALEFDDMLAAKKFARALAGELKHSVILVDRKSGGLMTTVIN